jgi:hypothetical protein
LIPPISDTRHGGSGHPGWVAVVDGWVVGVAPEGQYR